METMMFHLSVKQNLLIAIALTVTWLGLSGFDLMKREDPQVARANRLYHDEAFAKSAEIYQRILDGMDQDDPDRPLLHYNRGTALMGAGEEAAAVEELTLALMTREGSLKADNYYNMGNAFMNQSDKALETQRAQEALTILDHSIDSYKRGLRADPDNLDAKFNLELAMLKRHGLKEAIRRAREEQKNQEQDQDQQQQEGEQQEQQDEQQEQEDGQEQQDNQEQQEDQQGEDEQQQAENQQDQEGEQGEQEGEEQQDQQQEQGEEGDPQDGGEEEERQVQLMEMEQERVEELLKSLEENEKNFQMYKFMLDSPTQRVDRTGKTW
jgi:Ca-activated chloride channel homolog